MRQTSSWEFSVVLTPKDDRLFALLTLTVLAFGERGQEVPLKGSTFSTSETASRCQWPVTDMGYWGKAPPATPSSLRPAKNHGALKAGAQPLVRRGASGNPGKSRAITELAGG